jgi:hypothetical protein
MSIKLTNTQGTKVYVCATANTDVSDVTAIEAAIAAGSQIGCIQDLGAIGTTRQVNTYSCISEENALKSSGSLSLGNFTVSMLFNAADTAGQNELREIYAANENRTMIVALSDDGGASPTYITFESFVSAQDLVLQKDNAVLLNSTCELASNPEFTDAA